MPPEDNTPDFDSMSPEEIMAWMEALAVRQGATEGIISDESSRPQVAEVDPNSVDTSQLGNYIPYGMTAEQWEKKQAEEAAKKQASKSKTPFTPPPQTDLPVFDVEPDSPTQPGPVTEPASTGGLDWLSGLASGTEPEMPSASSPELDFGNLFQATQEELPSQFPELDLSGLNDLPNLDLPNFELEGLDNLASLAEGNTDPISWLEDLVGEDASDFPMPPTSNPFDAMFGSPTPSTSAPATENSIEWLESLAKRQGVSDEELITHPQVELPELTIDPNFQPSAGGDPFNFDDVDNLDQATIDATDPVAWLEGLASAQNAKTVTPPPGPKEVSTEDVLSKLNQGISDPDDMKGWMDKLLEEGAKRQVPDYISEEEEEVAIEANIPDWLVEQVGLPPTLSGASTEAPAEIDFDLLADAPVPTDEMPDWLMGNDSPLQAEAVGGDMPDWLTETLGEQTDEVQAIFQSGGDVGSLLSTEEIEVDMNDPWVEAFELERQVAMGIISDEEVIYSDAPVEIDLDDVLDDEPLPMGEPEAVPAWMDVSALPATPAPAPVPDVPQAMPTYSDMPDWLKSETDESPVVMSDDLPDWLSGIENTDDVPDWLLETVTDEQDAPVFTPPPPTPAPAPIQTPVVAPVPQRPQASPAPTPNVKINVVEVLQEARTKLQTGDVEGSLVAYEAVIRANTALDTVVSDLSALVKQEGNKTNPSVYRVLGDGLMRQGNLQQALDTYRKALNLL